MQLYLPDDTEQALQELALQQGKTTADLVQEAIRLYLCTNQKKQPKSIGLGRSNQTNLSERVDALLWQEV